MFTSVATELATEIRNAIKANDEKSIAILAAKFYEDIDHSGFDGLELDDRCHVNEHGFTIVVRGCPAFPEERRVYLEYSASRRSWCLAGVHGGYRVAELLGVPISYLEGLRTSLKLFHRTGQSLVREHKDLAQRIKAVQKREQRCSDALDANARLKATQRVAEANTEIARYHIDPVPPPMIDVRNLQRDTLPNKPGCYFVWNDGDIVYVGMSMRLRQRVTPSHDKIGNADSLSWIVMDGSSKTRILGKEAVYIDAIQPERNFS